MRNVFSPRSASRLVAPAIGVVGFLALWELAVVAFGIQPFELPKPSTIVRHVADDPGFYAENSVTTMWEAFVGFAVAFVTAMVVASVMAHSAFVERAVQPVAILLQVTPIIAYAPAIVIWQGFGFPAVVMITALVCFVPFLLNGVAGLRSVDPLLLELASSVDASRWEVFWRLRVPSALPYLFAAARIAIGLALVGAVLGEFFAGVNEGLGYTIKVAQQRPALRMQLWGSIFVLAFLGAASTLLLNTIERFSLRWHSSQRS